MKLATLAIAFTVLVSGTAFAGGNPDEEQDGAMTREMQVKDAKALIVPVIPDQDEIKKQIEAEIRRGWVEMNLSKPQIPPTELVDVPREEPITVVRCAFVFEWLAKQMGGECFRDSNFHNPSPVGYSTIHGTKTVEVEKTDRFHKNFGRGWKAKKRAVRTAHRLAKKGYKVRVGYKHGWRVKAKKTYTEEIEVPTVTRIRNDNAGSSNAGTAGDSNFGDRERDFGPGRGNK